MKIYVPNEELKRVSDALNEEKVTFEVSDKVYTLMVAEEKIGEVTEVNAALVETDVPVIFDRGPEITMRAFRLPSGRKFLLTDANGNFVSLVEPPPGWER
jgi:predicted enzyme related to lactoylglutathione lyase